MFLFCFHTYFLCCFFHMLDLFSQSPELFLPFDLKVMLWHDGVLAGRKQPKIFSIASKTGPKNTDNIHEVMSHTRRFLWVVIFTTVFNKQGWVGLSFSRKFFQWISL